MNVSGTAKGMSGMHVFEREINTEPDQAIMVDYPGTAKVLLYDETQYQAYITGVPHSATLSLEQAGPAFVQPPRGDDWHVVVELPRTASEESVWVELVPDELGDI